LDKIQWRNTVHSSELIYPRIFIQHMYLILLDRNLAVTNKHSPYLCPTRLVFWSVSIMQSGIRWHNHHAIVVSLLFLIMSSSPHSLFIILTNPWSLCYNIPTLHHYPYLSLTNQSDDSELLLHSIFSWLVNCHMSWPPRYIVYTIVRIALQLCNLRTLLCPSQSSVLLQTSQSSISRALSIRFALLHLCLSLKSSITFLGFAPSLAQPRITSSTLYKVHGGYTTEARPLVHGSKEVAPVY